MYASAGRPSIPPEKLLRAPLLQMLYSIRSERLLMEEIDYSVLFRWFVGLNLDEEVLNSARNANKPTPVASAIMTKKVNVPRRLASMGLHNRVTSHRKTKKIDSPL
jgi:transposase